MVPRPGPLARSVGDCALLQNVIAGPHPGDVASLRPKLEIPGRLEPVTGMRIALSVDLGCYEVDDAVAANTRAAADPPLEPPGEYAVFHGLRVTPHSFVQVNGAQENSGVVDRACTMPPASMMRWTNAAV